jgi:hypothetical protein
MLNKEAKIFVEWLKGRDPEQDKENLTAMTVQELYNWSQKQVGTGAYDWGTFSEEEFTKALLMAADAARFSESPLN